MPPRTAEASESTTSAVYHRLHDAVSLHCTRSANFPPSGWRRPDPRPVLCQAFQPCRRVEAFDVGIVRRLARPGEFRSYAVGSAPWHVSDQSGEPDVAGALFKNVAKFDIEATISSGDSVRGNIIFKVRLDARIDRGPDDEGLKLGDGIAASSGFAAACDRLCGDPSQFFVQLRIRPIGL